LRPGQIPVFDPRRRDIVVCDRFDKVAIPGELSIVDLRALEQVPGTLLMVDVDAEAGVGRMILTAPYRRLARSSLESCAICSHARISG
jgi:hypothetical protein